MFYVRRNISLVKHNKIGNVYPAEHTKSKDVYVTSDRCYWLVHRANQLSDKKTDRQIGGVVHVLHNMWQQEYFMWPLIDGSTNFWMKDYRQTEKTCPR
jgi:hypothetical protein